MCQNAFPIALSNEGELTPASLGVRAKSGFQVSVDRSLGVYLCMEPEILF